MGASTRTIYFTNSAIAWEFDVKEILRPGENEIIILFESALLAGREKLAERYIHSWSTDTHKLPVAGLVAEYDPAADYWPSSPHSPHGNRYDWNNPHWGDAHVWEVWHGKQPFEYYRTCRHRFCSEFGFQSFPEPRTVEKYTTPEERNITSYVMEHHQRSDIGNQT
ncbi:MAG: hypothetical protein P8169_14995, partial [Chloroflexota bacterium]